MDNDQLIKKQKNKPEPKQETKQGWLVTYADMMTLLFAFFVMMFSMSSPDPVKMSQIKDAMQKEAGKEGIIQSQHEIKEEVQKIVNNLDLQDVANVIEDPRGVALEMDGDICFSSGSTEIKSTLKAVLNKAAQKILTNEQDHRMVIIEGHTDNRPIPKTLKKIYPTNWELSAGRASKVVNYLIKNSVNSGRLQASGYADRWPAGVSWYDVRSGTVNDQIIIEQNSTETQRQKNRRIKIIFTNN